MRVSIRYLTVLASLLIALGGFSSYAMAQIDFSDDFESYALNTGVDLGDLGGGWNMYVNVFGPHPVCDSRWYGYGTFPAPNKHTGVSNISMGSFGKALNVFSDYVNGDHANGGCIETNVFQEETFNAADAGSYTFMFTVEAASEPLGAGVSTKGYIKLLDPDNGYATVEFWTVSTESEGVKSLTKDLDASYDGMLLQWGFQNIANNYEDSGRFYDNVSFALEGTVPPPSVVPGPANIQNVPIPLWAYLGLGGLLAYFGVLKVRARRKL